MKSIVISAILVLLTTGCSTTSLLTCKVFIFDEEKGTKGINQTIKLKIDEQDKSKIVIYNEDEYPIIFGSNFSQPPFDLIKDLSTPNVHHFITKMDLGNNKNIEFNLLLNKSSGMLNYKYSRKTDFVTWDVALDGNCSK
jgi:hypothetical protein